MQTERDLSINVDETFKESLNYRSSDFLIKPYIIKYIHEQKNYMPLHWHHELQINWVYEGEVEFLIDGESIIMNKNSILFINSKKFHSSSTINDDAKTLCINFDLSFLPASIINEYLEPLLNNPNFSYVSIPAIDNIARYVNEIVSKIPDESNYLEKEEYYINYFQVINCINLIIEKMLIQYEDKDSNIKSVDFDVLNKLLSYIHNNYSTKIMIKDLLAHAHINKTYCNDLFQKYTKMSPIKYLIAYRLYIAQDLIINTTLPISDISQRCGFITLSYFVEQFRIHYNLAPLQYRNKYSGNH